MGPSLAVEGATTKAVFEVYIEKVLAPALKPGQMMVMDNLSYHKGPPRPGSWSRGVDASSCTSSSRPSRR